jgi:hypothetical protein
MRGGLGTIAAVFGRSRLEWAYGCCDDRPDVEELRQ